MIQVCVEPLSLEDGLCFPLLLFRLPFGAAGAAGLLSGAISGLFVPGFELGISEFDWLGVVWPELSGGG